MKGENLPVIQVMDETSQKQVMKNKTSINSIAQTVYFLTKQRLSLRVHRDDSKHLEESMNCGNFQELLEFRCEAGDKNLSAHFKCCHRNATYRSKIIENELIQIISNQILDGIIAKVKKAKFYAVAADKATDRDLQTQLTTTWRYVDEHGDVKDIFIGYRNITGDTTWENIADVLVEKLTALDLNCSHIRAQAYDGTGEKCWLFFLKWDTFG